MEVELDSFENTRALNSIKLQRVKSHPNYEPGHLGLKINILFGGQVQLRQRPARLKHLLGAKHCVSNRCVKCLVGMQQINPSTVVRFACSPLPLHSTQ